MDEKKYKVRYSLSIIVFVVALIVIVALGCWGVLIYKNKEDADKQASNLSNEVQGLRNDVTYEEEEQEKIVPTDDDYMILTENISGLEGMYVTNVEKDGDSYVLKGIMFSEYTFDEDKFDEIVADGEMILDGERYILKKGVEVEDALYELYQEGLDYPLYGIVILEPNVYKLNRYAQIGTVWKLTDVFGKVTVDADTEVFDDYFETSLTVQERFKDMKDENISFSKEELFEKTILDSGRTYSFEFEDGKCVRVIDVLTAI